MIAPRDLRRMTPQQLAAFLDLQQIIDTRMMNEPDFRKFRIPLNRTHHDPDVLQAIGTVYRQHWIVHFEDMSEPNFINLADRT